MFTPLGSKPQETRSGLWLGVFLSGSLVSLLAGCLAPRRGQDVSASHELFEGGVTAEALAARIAEGSEPVLADVSPGVVLPESDPFGLADPRDPGLATRLEEILEGESDSSAGSESEWVEPIRESPYLCFGERIIVKDEGGETFIRKLYSMPPGRGKKVLELIGALEPFPFRERKNEGDPAPFDPLTVEYRLLENWDQEYYTDFDAPIPKASTPIPLSDILVVTAPYSLLENFEEFLDLFASAGVPQIELEAKIIEITETDTTDIGISSNFVFDSDRFVQELDFNFPASTSAAVATLGTVQDNVTFNATLNLIESLDTVQINSKPKTVVRAGGVASIDSTLDIPFFEIKNFTELGNATGAIVYKKVGTQLFISPRIVGTKTLALEVHLIGSQAAGNVIVAGVQNQDLTAPQIAYRTAKTVVYLEPGQTLVIGGLTQNVDREVIDRVPILGDIPWLGLLFRSRFVSREKQTVLFAISPRIIQTSDFETEF